MDMTSFHPKAIRTDSCQSHGDYSSSLFETPAGELWSGCPACMLEARDREAMAHAEEASAERAQRRAAQSASRYGAALIPPRFADRTLETYKAASPQQDKVARICRAYASRWDEMKAAGRCMVLMGYPGTGKTHLSVGIAMVVMARGGSALFRSVPDAVGIVKSSYSKERTEDEAYRMLLEPDLLILDDVGAVRMSEHDLGVVHQILDDRYLAANRPTIITTNCPSVEEFEKTIGPRAADRLMENGGVVLQLDWESYRRARPTNGS